MRPTQYGGSDRLGCGLWVGAMSVQWNDLDP